MRNDAIIGHTGFVGGILDSQHDFTARFNSANIDTISGQTFNTVVCAAAPGSMFTANKQPDRDFNEIQSLINKLDGIRADRLILISSIAVLADFAAGDDEDTEKFQQDLAYGRHRRMLEEFCESRFQNCLIVRLPALFGPRLRKNFVFDLMNPVPTMLPQARIEELSQQLAPKLRYILQKHYSLDAGTGMLQLDRPALNDSSHRLALEDEVRAANMSATQFHNRDTTYQYYDMTCLWKDISIALQAELNHVHLAVAPLRAADIHARLLGFEMPVTEASLHYEDMRTRHAALWERDSHYLANAETVLDRLTAFIAKFRT